MICILNDIPASQSRRDPVSAFFFQFLILVEAMHCRHHADAVVWFRWGVCSVTTTTTAAATTTKGGEKRD